ncbi:MAG TPA: CHAT domain-containing tetratricopeptide repeat protein [Pyrinomonadaceae bacterium]|jgi:CHAT domain-containing protein|nr:CHAT domain-containing tetratricopeptide repeat protein [Pyrinomonadaceae bacterium]
MKRFYKYLAPTVLAVLLALQSLISPVTLAYAFVISPSPQTDPATSLSRGRALLKQGHADQALPLLQSALAAFTSTNNADGVAAAEDAIGDLYMIQGQYKVALDHYKSAYQSFVVASGKDQTGASAANNIAGRANATAGAASESATRTLDNGFNANLMLAKIGDTNYRLGQMSDASTAYFQMNVSKPESAAAKTTRRLGGLGGIIGGISTGRVSVEAPTTSAIGLLETTKELQEYRKAIVYMTFELGMGRIAFANKDLETARKHFQNALDAGSGALPVIAKMGQTRRFRAAARTSLGDVALREGRYKDAAKMFTDAAEGARKDDRLDLMWPAQRGVGRSLWLQAAQEKDGAKMREQALNSYREALKTIETIREGSLHADESRTTFLATTVDVYDEASSACAEMALMSASGNASLSSKALDYGAESFRIAEAGRARSLLDMLGEVKAQITEGVPADLLKKKQDNLDRQQQIAEQLTGIALSGDEKQKPSDLENELDKLQTEFDQIENQIRTASPKYAALTGGQPLSLTEVQQKVLDDNTVLLEYALGADNSYLFAVTKSGVSLYKLPRRADVEQLATNFRAQLIPPKLQRRIVGIDVAVDQQRGLGIVQGPSEDLPPFVAASNALFKAVIEPAASIVADKRILVVADGVLNYIPFGALVKNADGGADYASLNYLVKTNEIVYAPSASVIGAIRGSSPTVREGAPGSMLLVADPVFSADDPRAKGNAASASSGETRGLGLGLESAVNDVAGNVDASSGGLHLARLSGTRMEADEISKIAKSANARADLWTDLNASEDNVKSRDVTSYRYLHVATHGLLDAERPQFTGVVLSLVGNKTNDGFLRTDEIFNLKLGSPFVMLSACETGLGKEKRGEGVIGLTRAFMYAGAPTVGVSLWSVADKSTADLMTDFYKRLLGATPASPAAAMRDAQLAMINGKKYSAPFYWAPFVLVGEWNYPFAH